MLPEGSDMFYLRCWVGLVGAVALFNGFHCYMDPEYTRRRIYTLQPKEAGALFTRMFGNWVLLAGAVRIAFAVSAMTMSLYLLTFLSFMLAFFHFAYEVFVAHSAPLGVGTISPLLIAGFSILWMLPIIVQAAREQLL